MRSTFLRRLRALLGRPSPRPAPATRLRPGEAAAIAERAAGRPGTRGHAVPRQVDGAIAWDVCQVSKGSGWRVRVDDATGEAGPVTRWGVR